MIFLLYHDTNKTLRSQTIFIICTWADALYYQFIYFKHLFYIQHESQRDVYRKGKSVISRVIQRNDHSSLYYSGCYFILFISITLIVFIIVISYLGHYYRKADQSRYIADNNKIDMDKMTFYRPMYDIISIITAMGILYLIRECLAFFITQDTENLIGIANALSQGQDIYVIV